MIRAQRPVLNVVEIFDLDISSLDSFKSNCSTISLYSINVFEYLRKHLFFKDVFKFKTL